MPFIHRVPTARQEQEALEKKFRDAVRQQYPGFEHDLMTILMRLPFERLERACRHPQHLNIYIDLALKRLTGFSRYEVAVKESLKSQTADGISIGYEGEDEREDIALDMKQNRSMTSHPVENTLPSTMQVLLAHLRLNVAPLVEADALDPVMDILANMYSKSNVLDMLEQPRLLRKRTRLALRSLRPSSSNDPATSQSMPIYDDDVSPSSVQLRHSDSRRPRGVARPASIAMLTNDFDSLFALAKLEEPDDSTTFRSEPSLVGDSRRGVLGVNEAGGSYLLSHVHLEDETGVPHHASSADNVLSLEVAENERLHQPHTSKSSCHHPSDVKSSLVRVRSSNLGCGQAPSVTFQREVSVSNPSLTQQGHDHNAVNHLKKDLIAFSPVHNLPRQSAGNKNHSENIANDKGEMISMTPTSMDKESELSRFLKETGVTLPSLEINSFPFQVCAQPCGIRDTHLDEELGPPDNPCFVDTAL